MWNLSSVQSNPVCFNVSCKGGSPPLLGVLVEAEEACLQELFFQLVCRPNTSSSLQHSRTEKLKCWSIKSQSLRNKLLLLCWTDSSPCCPLGGLGGCWEKTASEVQSKGYSVKFPLLFLFMLLKMYWFSNYTLYFSNIKSSGMQGLAVVDQRATNQATLTFPCWRFGGSLAQHSWKLTPR